MAVDFKDSETKENLMRAFAGESQARNRYSFAAEQAKGQKLHVIEAVFRYTADQEREHAKDHNSALHLLSYLTYKSSHGCIDYPLQICEMAREHGLERVFLHIIFDGRSTDPGSAPALLAETDQRLKQIGVGRIVDGVGRGVVLDRDKNYDKVKRAYDAMVDGVGSFYQ